MTGIIYINIIIQLFIAFELLLIYMRLGKK